MYCVTVWALVSSQLLWSGGPQSVVSLDNGYMQIAPISWFDLSLLRLELVVAMVKPGPHA